MRVRSLNKVGRAVQTDRTLLRYVSAITEEEKFQGLLAQKFDRFQTSLNNSQHHAATCNNMQQGVQTDATCNIQRRELLANNVASVWTGINRLSQLTLLISSINSTFVEGDGFIYYLLVLLLYVKNQINSRGYNESACMVILQFWTVCFHGFVQIVLRDARVLKRVHY